VPAESLYTIRVARRYPTAPPRPPLSVFVAYVLQQRNPACGFDSSIPYIPDSSFLVRITVIGRTLWRSAGDAGVAPWTGARPLKKKTGPLARPFDDSHAV
jgi:hypothetical protein